MSLASIEHQLDRAVAYACSRYQALGVFLLVTCLSFGALAADPDLFARVAIGRLIEISPEFPRHDPFSFTQTKELWISHEWMSGVVFFALSQLGGDLSLFIFKCLMMLSSIVLLDRARTLLWGRGTGDAVWLLFAAAASHYIWASTVRCQVFTYLFIPLLFWAFAVFDKQRIRWPLFLAASVMPFWSGAHGGFVVGLGFWGFFWFSKLLGKREDLLVVSLAFALAIGGSLLSPYGTTLYWSFILDAVFKSRPSITEWAPVTLFSAQSFAPLLFLVALVAGGLALMKKLPQGRGDLYVRGVTLLYPTLVVGAGAFQGWKHERLLAIFFMGAVVYGAPLLRTATSQFASLLGRWYPMATRASFLLSAGCIVYSAILWSTVLLKPSSFSLNYEGYPVQAIEWLRSQGGLGGRLLVDFNNGSYAFWRGYPALQTSLDGRYEEVFPDQTVQKVSAALEVNSPEHAAALAWVNPTTILLSKKSSGYAAREKFGSEWLLVYEDASFALLSRHLSDNKPVVIEPTWKPLF